MSTNICESLLRYFSLITPCEIIFSHIIIDFFKVACFVTRTTIGIYIHTINGVRGTAILNELFISQKKFL